MNITVIPAHTPAPHGPTQARLTINVPEAPPHTHLCFAIDSSGSMQGQPTELARQALIHISELLSDTQLISVVTFATDATLLLPPTPAREATQKLHGLRWEARGGTNLHAGWLLACQTIANHDHPGRVHILTDGHANAGLRGPDLHEQIRTVAHNNLSSSFIGLGLSYHQELLTELADAGEGLLDHAQNPEELADALTRQLTMGVTAARTITINTTGAELAPEQILMVLRSGETRHLLLDIPAHSDAIHVTLRSHNPDGQTCTHTAEHLLERGATPGPADPTVLTLTAQLTAQRTQKQALLEAQRGNIQRSRDILRAGQADLQAMGPQASLAAADLAQALHYTSDARTAVYGLTNSSYNAVRGRRVTEEPAQIHHPTDKP